jgi:hypothetical protein
MKIIINIFKIISLILSDLRDTLNEGFDCESLENKVWITWSFLNFYFSCFIYASGTVEGYPIFNKLMASATWLILSQCLFVIAVILYILSVVTITHTVDYFRSLQYRIDNKQK